MDKEKFEEIAAQKETLKRIVENGIKFSINRSIKTRQKGLLGFLRPKIITQITEEYTIQQPTLGVLDRCSKVWLEFKLSELEGLEESKAMDAGYELAHRHAKDMALVLAMMVVGEAYFCDTEWGEKEIERLTDLFYHSVKPSQVFDLSLFISTASGLVDFVNSMRLMQMSDTTAPTNRIDEWSE
ncbi:MAG: hypothetical protein IKH61_12790 [Bacteroidales bacterium]|nr:hypothetical protein [Bacteroidales bacterium]